MTSWQASTQASPFRGKSNRRILEKLFSWCEKQNKCSNCHSHCVYVRAYYLFSYLTSYLSYASSKANNYSFIYENFISVATQDSHWFSATVPTWRKLIPDLRIILVVW